MKIIQCLVSTIPAHRAKPVVLRWASILLLCTSGAAQDGWGWFEDAKLVASDAAPNQHFGGFVAIDGDTALVQALGGDYGTSSGAVYVFVRDGSTWSQQARLIDPSGAALDHFGIGVDLDGDTALIGAWGDDGLGAQAGAAHVFVRTGTTWTHQAELTAPGGQADDTFGFSVEIEGDTAVIGSPEDDDQGVESGSAYVFVRSGTSWTYEAKLLAGDGVAYDYFGYDVSVSGESILVGAVNDDDHGFDSGSAYVYTRQGSVWTQEAKLTASDGAAVDHFGLSVTLDGDLALVGAPEQDSPGSSSGAAYVFARINSSWSQQQKLVPQCGQAGDQFGMCVALDGDTALIGAEQGDGVVLNSGTAYVFTLSGGTWSEYWKLMAGDGADQDSFGYALDLDGDTALVGAWRDDDAGTSSGSAYVFERKVLASATFRNTGSNPSSYDAITLPIIGENYVCTIDLAGTSGHALTWLVGYSTPASLVIGSGQYLLVNPFDPNGELLQQPVLAGPVASYALPIPNDIAFAGFELATQALHVGGIQPFALSNARDLVLGF